MCLNGVMEIKRNTLSQQAYDQGMRHGREGRSPVAYKPNTKQGAAYLEGYAAAGVMLTTSEIRDLLQQIAAGTAFSVEVEDELEQRGYVRQTHQPYAQLTPKGRALIP
jgi:hypothetical protein